MNAVIEALMNRTSLRVFAEKDIPKDIKTCLFECAMQAPTAGNQMLYSIIDITEQSLKEKLAVSCDNQGFIAKAPMVTLFVADQQKWFDYYKAQDVKGYCEMRDDMTFEAPQESDLILAIEDAMIAAQNMVIAAESLGMGSCYIGDIVENYEYVKELLNLPPWVFPVGMLVLGYPPENHKKVFRKRFDQQYVVFNNRYQQLSEEQQTEMFREQSARFNPNNTIGAKNWAQQFYHRKTGASFSKEMARSVRVAMKQWDGRKL